MTSGGRRRLFFALPASFTAPESFRKIESAMEDERRSLKIVRPEHFHITVKFLGPVEEPVFLRLKEGFERAPLPLSPIEYRIAGTGAFPSLQRPSVLWCGILTDIGLLREMQDSIERLCQQLGFERERRAFTPHLTIARVREKARLSEGLLGLLRSHGETLFAESRFDGIVLFESLLTPKGPLYRRTAARDFR
ncbi:MAG: RNA 2',3'-cyclic phosphodiesterase [Spirochaetes bacterium]|nr:RNA 2',3'-cyclic phosphodiesterase [Spirochaetota bacterium]